MYPAGELKRLADRKAIVQARIAVHRWECVAAAVELARPIAMVDRVRETWRTIAPFVKLASVPAAFFALRSATKRAGGGKLSKLTAALPLVLRTLRTVQQARAAMGAR
jgi:hypothetical protein